MPGAGDRVLGAFGLDVLLRSAHDCVVIRWAAGGFAAAGVVLAGLLVAVRTRGVEGGRAPQGALIWPAAQVVVGLGLVAGLWWWGHPCRMARPLDDGRPGSWWRPCCSGGPDGLPAQRGAPFWSVSSEYFTPEPAVTALQDSVGSSLVGTDLSSSGVPHVESGRSRDPPGRQHRVRDPDIVIYDPILPRSYYQLLAVSGVHSPRATTLGVFCPRITTATQARVYALTTCSSLPTTSDRRAASTPGPWPANALPHPGLGQCPPWSARRPAHGWPTTLPHPESPPGMPVAGHVFGSRRRGVVVVDSFHTPGCCASRLAQCPGWDRRPSTGIAPRLRTWATGSLLEQKVAPPVATSWSFDTGRRSSASVSAWPWGTVVAFVLAWGVQIVTTRRRRRLPRPGRAHAGAVPGPP